MLVALLVSLALVASAPFVGEFRRWIAATLPGQYVWLVNGAVALSAAGVAALALARIRVDRGWRFGAILLAGALAVAYAWATGSPVAAVAAVEHVHFAQYGVMTWLFYRAWRPRGDLSSVLLPVSAAILFGTVEEWWQWFLPARVGELRDVLMNIAAITSGILVSVAIAPLKHGWREILTTGRAASAAGVAAAALGLVVFTWTVHVGHAIEDAETGRFLSRYSGVRLLELSADRAALWAADPPLVRRTLAREDQYRSEGEAHVRARNTAWDREDYRTAWHENLILERYYAPVLDTPSHISATGHRWHPDHRTDAERRVADLPQIPFVSYAPVDTRYAIDR